MQEHTSGYDCPRCSRNYRRLAGLPDLRVQPPGSFDVAKDLYFAELLQQREQQLTFQELLAYYYTLNPPANERLHGQHMAHFEVEGEQAAAAIAELAESRSCSGTEPLLDVGCGLGQYLRAGLARFKVVVGIDLSLAQLVLARKHLEEAGQTVLLAAAQSEHLPFPVSAFGAAVAADSLEHVADAATAVREVSRVLMPGAGFYVSTPNRFSLTPEPHVGIWGLGYWPRSLATWHVRNTLNIRYDDIRLFSFLRLQRLLRLSFEGQCHVRLPRIGRREAQSFSPRKRGWARLYEAVRAIPLLRIGLYIVVPYFQAICVKRSAPQAD